jgi:hypothetical protein
MSEVELYADLLEDDKPEDNADFFANLLAEDDKPKPTRTSSKWLDMVTPKVGPLRRKDSFARCASRGCSSPTHLEVRGVPRCITHALNELNHICVDAGVTE